MGFGSLICFALSAMGRHIGAQSGCAYTHPLGVKASVGALHTMKFRIQVTFPAYI